MRTLVISDLHSSRKCLDYLEQILANQKIDNVICAGDITTFDETDYLDLVIEKFKSKKVEGFFIAGNNDRENVREELSKNDFDVNLKERKLGIHKIIGISDGLEENIFNFNLNNKILVTHRPPSAGNLKSKFKNSPKFHISGHIHSRLGVFRYPSVTHVQIPSLMLNKYLIADFEAEKFKFF